MNTIRVGCIGSGVIGSSWAVTFARAGLSVAVYDVSLSARTAAESSIGRMLTVLSREGEIRSLNEVRSRIRFVASVEEAASEATLVQESVREDLETKRILFAELDRVAPSNAILASSTSEIPSSQFTERLHGRARCLVAHPLNPPHLVPLVEICPSPWTDISVVSATRRFFDSVGQQPIVVQREIPGFIANRMQVAVIIEGVRLVAEGYCTPEDLDRAMSQGLGMRWTLMGPLATNRFAAPRGYEQFLNEYWHTLQSIAATLQPDYVPPPGTGHRIEEALKQASGADTSEIMDWRDVALIRLARLLKELDSQREKAKGPSQ